jgi:energy-coupling factor transporter ATP-binding protein EcfA2
MTVDEAQVFFTSDESVKHTLNVLHEVGLGYLRLGQSATELSGGEAQRIKLATELQRMGRADMLYVLDEPTTGLHPSDVCRLLVQLQSLVASGNTVLVVEHDMDVITVSDWIIDIGPGAGDEGGKVVAFGSPERVAKNKISRTARSGLMAGRTLSAVSPPLFASDLQFWRQTPAAQGEVSPALPSEIDLQPAATRFRSHTREAGYPLSRRPEAPSRDCAYR